MYNYDELMYNEYKSPMQAMGIYTPDTQFDMSPEMLSSMGFPYQYIETLKYILSMEGRVTPAMLTQRYGLSYEDARNIKYMYDIITGKVVIESDDDIAKHLRRLNGKHRRLGIQDLAVSKVQEVPRLAVIAGIADDKFKIYNSKAKDGSTRLYKVINVSSSRITIETNIKPVLKFKESKKSDELEILDVVLPNGLVDVAVNKDFIRLCNRFVIVGSLKRPEFHHGLVEIICIEGTRVYVYASSMGTGKTVSYRGGTQRVYDFGVHAREIRGKLMQVAEGMYNRVCGVVAYEREANSDFKVLIKENKEEQEDLEFDDENNE